MMTPTIPILFNTYTLTDVAGTASVRCHGCQELQHPGLDAPAHIVGLIRFRGKLIPVLDPALLFCQMATPLANSTCILVVEHHAPGKLLHTGILIPDSQEILELASGTYSSGPMATSTVNMNFVLAIPENMHAAMFLAENHRIVAAAVRPVPSRHRSPAAIDTTRCDHATA